MKKNNQRLIENGVWVVNFYNCIKIRKKLLFTYVISLFQPSTISLIIFVIFFYAGLSFSQVPDSTARTFQNPAQDTSRTFKKFSSNEDTVKAPPLKIARTGIDSVVHYTAKIIESDLKKNITYLIGDAEVKFKKMTLKAGKITVLWDTHTLIAEGLPDTTNGANGSSPDSLRRHYTQLPVFSDGTDTMRGFRMEYNFKTERGRVIRGRSEIEGGFYFGEAVKRVAPRVFNIANGTYTTCDKEEPHYHFKGKRMKVIMDDKVIARPVIFFIGKIPVAFIPFAIFPTKKGRQSGLIMPRFGSSRQEGRFLRNLGYYWATNDYMDTRFTVDFFERSGFLFRTDMNYALRYHFRGSLSGSFARRSFPGNLKETRWDFRINHSQEIDANTRLSVNASFVSNNSFYQEFSQNRSQRLQRQLISNATFTKSWGDGKNSLTLNLSETRDLETGASSRTLPRLRFNRNRSQFFPFKKSKKGGRSTENAKWYNYIYYTYSGTYLNLVRKDSTNDPDPRVERRADHTVNINFTSPKRIFGWLSFSQSINYREKWVDRTKSFSIDTLTNRVVEHEDKGFAARRIFSVTASANTKLYGLFPMHLGPVKAIRHVMTPSISFSYRPDFSSPFWGYYQTLKDTNGVEIKRDRFGGTPRGEVASLNFTLSNLFQMKLGEGEKEKKINLFNLDFRSGYNFAADSLKLQNLFTTFRANPRRNLGISMNMTHSFYDFDRETGRTIDKLLVNSRGLFKFIRLTQLRFDLHWRLSGKKGGPGKSKKGFEQKEATEVEEEGSVIQQNQSPFGNRFEPENAFSAFDIPWRANVSFSFSINKFNPTRVTRTAYIDLSNVELQLTRKWRVGYRVRYDLENGEIADQRISLYRDLHCWEAQFNWSPSGVSRGFYFKINIKASHLQNIKIEQRGGTTSIFSPF
ncbi:MAG: LPS-assembly protein LptD [Calditrichaeota bacterium]|nr:MAG: LPS-assembly protein LptD [Calditrichota bacterium]